MRVAALIASLWFSCVSTAEEPGKALDKLQGDWQVMQFVENGHELPHDVVEHLKVHINGDRFSYTLPMPDEPSQLSPLTIEFAFAMYDDQPRAFDIRHIRGSSKREVRHGIYELQNDILRVCVALRSASNRPDSFEARKGSGLGQMTLRRCKKD
jgi:uncharacterized protein (TIGR03067 family)